MNEDNFTGLGFSKKLKENGCKLESNAWWYNFKSFAPEYKPKWVLRFGEESSDSYSERIPAYDILNDICVKYAKEFFGDRMAICFKCLSVDEKNHCDSTDQQSGCDEFHPRQIFFLLQQGKKKEAELYIEEHCFFNPKNRVK